MHATHGIQVQATVKTLFRKAVTIFLCINCPALKLNKLMLKDVTINGQIDRQEMNKFGKKNDGLVHTVIRFYIVIMKQHSY